MYGFLALGALIIVTNYVGILPAGTSNKYLIGGLVLAGIGTLLGVASAASSLISRKSATAEPPPADPALSTSLTRASVDEHYVERESTNPFATASLVLSLVGFIAGIGAILGVIFGYIALSQIKKSGQGGRGLALAGVIIGWIEIAAAIGLVVWVFANL